MLTRRFADDVGKTVSSAMRDEEMLKKMILAIVGPRPRGRRCRPVGRRGGHPAALGRRARRAAAQAGGAARGHADPLCRGYRGEMLRAGVRFGRAEDESEGLRVKLHDRGVTVDITDRAVAEAILEHLQPRFRALMEGVVK
jgi:V/A-type H+/Na+-transporting ATPase subunit E